MNKTTKTGIEMLEASLILGLAGNFLLRTEQFGLNLALWSALFAVAMIALLKRSDAAGWNTNSISLFTGLVFFSSMFAFFDSPQLLALDGVALALILAALVLPALSYDLTRSGAVHYLLGGIAAALSAVIGPIALVGDDIKWGTLPKSGVTRNAFSVVRGLVLAVPIGLVIGGLLMAADSSFQSFVLDNLSFDPREVIVQTTIVSAISWAVLGYFRAAVFGVGPKTEEKRAEEISVVQPGFSVTEHTTEDPADSAKENAKPAEDRKSAKEIYEFFPAWLRLGVIETSIVLGMLNLMFMAFVVFQIPYLFGGMDLVQQTPDFKLAEYARRGVTELIMVSMLVLPILLSMHWLLKKGNPTNEKVFRVLSSVQIGLLFVIMISAAQRINLLTGSLGYGQTAIRFYSYFFLIWLSLVFVWFGMTVLRGMRKQFAYGALWSFLFVVAMLHYVNPDDYIVRTNVDLMKHGRSFDAAYNSSLSADAVPALIESLDHMPEAHQETVYRKIGAGILCSGIEKSDFRTWNRSRSIAKELFAVNRIHYEDSCYQ